MMRLVKMVAVFSLCVSMCGCSWLFERLDFKRRAEGYFPRLDSARAQYYYAAELDRNTIVGRPGQEAERKLSRLIAAYQEVLDHFPEDQYFTPLAMASIGNCYFRMGKYKKTIALFKRAKKAYPNYPFVHAEAEWKIGRSLELLGKLGEAKQHYKQCIDTFRHNENAQIQAIVKLCSNRWVKPTIPARSRRPR